MYNEAVYRMEIPPGSVPASNLSRYTEFQSKIFGACNRHIPILRYPQPPFREVLPGVVGSQATSTNSEDRGFPLNGKVP